MCPGSMFARWTLPASTRSASALPAAMHPEVNRSRSYAASVLLAVCALGWTGAAPAEVVITDPLRHYPVHASTLQALRQGLQAGIPEAQPDHPSGMTVAQLRWEASYESTPAGCRVIAHRVALDIMTDLPEWQERLHAPLRLGC